jgi:hypothetical protein
MRVKFTQETADEQRGEDSQGNVDRNQVERCFLTSACMLDCIVLMPF